LARSDGLLHDRKVVRPASAEGEGKLEGGIWDEIHAQHEVCVGGTSEADFSWVPNGRCSMNVESTTS
jgi:hypothetical protein